MTKIINGITVVKYGNRYIAINEHAKSIGVFKASHIARFFCICIIKNKTTKQKVMDFFGIKSQRENDAYKKAIEHEPRAQYNFQLIMATKNMERLLVAVIAAVIFWFSFRGC